MPEGPSIVIAKEAIQRFVGCTIRRVSGNSKQDIQRLRGCQIVAVRSWGKHLLIQLEGFTLRIHFMLFGSYLIDARKPTPPRLSLGFGDRQEFNLYACSVKFIEQDLDEVYDWGADVMNPAWDPARARKKLKQRPDRLVADVLLDQEIFAGVGNIIKNEVLHRIRVHPMSTIGALPARKLSQLIAQAREYSFDFYAWKKQYVLRKHYQAHTKQWCPRDNNRLSYRKHLGNAQRRAFFCEVCQRLYVST